MQTRLLHQKLHLTSQAKRLLTGYSIHFIEYHIRDPVPDVVLDMFNQPLSNENVIQLAYSLRASDSTSQINALSYCLALDLLPLFQKLRVFNETVLDSPEYKATLHRAAAVGSEGSIQRLRGFRYSVHTRDDHVAQPLYHAARGGRDRAARAFLKNGADVNAQGGEHGNPSQAAAAHAKGAPVVRILLGSGANPNAEGGFYGTALQAAARSGSEIAVHMLLDHGADVNAQGGKDSSALQAAINLKNERVAEMLLNNGAYRTVGDEVYRASMEGAGDEGMPGPPTDEHRVTEP